MCPHQAKLTELVIMGSWFWEVTTRAMTDAIAALHAAVPELSAREAMLEAVAAVSDASQTHPKWLYALHRPRREADDKIS